MPVRILKRSSHETYRDTKTEAERKFYSSNLWRRTSEQHRQTELFCRECMRRGIYRQGQMTDHITPIRLGGHRTDPGNLQTLCNPCHNAKRQAERLKG